MCYGFCAKQGGRGQNKGFVMKKSWMFACLFVGVCGVAFASDYTYTETETVSTWESVNYAGASNDGCNMRYYSSRDVRPVAAPCGTPRSVASQPVRVKTHTEVIDHYQVYQPVTVYKPMGTQVQRRVVPVKSCNGCN